MPSEDGRAEDPCFEVAISEGKAVVYPVRAPDADRAIGKVIGLVEGGRVRSPVQVARDVGAMVEVVAGEASDSDAVSCARAADALGLSESERRLLLGARDEPRREAPDPRKMAQAARTCLKRTGSGALQPSKRRRA